MSCQKSSSPSPDMRRKGVAMLSYPAACRVFVERFNLNELCLRRRRKTQEEVIDFGVVKSGTNAKVFEWTRAELLLG